MERKYQVFVSSTYQDLVEERKEVIQALLELDCIPVGMELFPAADDSQWEFIRKTIDESDYYIAIIGGRYGSLSEHGKSYTEQEYLYATETGKPVLAFLHGNPEQLPVSKVERDSDPSNKLESFRNLTKQRLVQFYTSPADLGTKVSRSLVSLIKRHPQSGWVRSENIGTHGINLSKDNDLQSKELQKEVYRISKKLDDLIFLQAEKTKPEQLETKSNKIKIFIGSSTEGLEISRYIQTELAFDYHATIWNQGTVFGLGDATIEALERAVLEFDFAVFVFSPDDQVVTRGETQIVARDNVIFELGLFIGKLSRLHTFVVHPRGIRMSFPSDLSGLTMASFDPNHPHLQAALGPACHAIRDAIKRVIDNC